MIQDHKPGIISIDPIQDAAEFGLDQAGIGTHDPDGDDSLSVMVLQAGLRNGDSELPANPVYKRAQDAAFRLERTGIPEIEMEIQHSEVRRHGN